MPDIETHDEYVLRLERFLNKLEGVIRTLEDDLSREPKRMCNKDGSEPETDEQFEQRKVNLLNHKRELLACAFRYKEGARKALLRATRMPYAA